MELTTLERFDVHDTATVTPRWRKWRRAFDYFLVAKGVTSAAQKKALLLHLAGPDVQDIFDTLPVPAVDEQHDEYAVALAALDQYFQPRVNVPYERHLFRQLRQESHESVSQFATRLSKQAEYCDFAERKEEYIRDQIIENCKSGQ